MSRISNRASTVVALISIALLVLFLVILWTGVRITKQETIERNVDGSRDAAEETLGSFLRERSNESLSSSSSSSSSSLSSSSSSTTVKIVFDEESFNNEGRNFLLLEVIDVSGGKGNLFAEGPFGFYTLL